MESHGEGHHWEFGSHRTWGVRNIVTALLGEGVGSARVCVQVKDSTGRGAVLWKSLPPNSASLLSDGGPPSRKLLSSGVLGHSQRGA